MQAIKAKYPVGTGYFAFINKSFLLKHQSLHT